MMEFIKLFADENTLARMECEMLANNPNAKRYSSFKEFLWTRWSRKMSKKYTLLTSTAFKRDYKKMQKRNYDISLLNDVIETLLNGNLLPEKIRITP